MFTIATNITTLLPDSFHSTIQSSNSSSADMTETSKAFSNFAEFYAKGIEFTGSFVEYGLPLMPRIASDSVVHDNASGPGVAAFIIAKYFQGKGETCPRIYATDLAPGMIDAAKKGIKERGLEACISAELLDAEDLKSFENDMFTHSITNFAIMAPPDPAKAASETHRTLKPNGAALVTSWKISAAAIVDRVCERIRPGQPIFAPFSSDWVKKEKLVDTLVAGGFEKEKIEIYEKTNYARFASEEELVKYMTNPFWGLWRKGWTEEETSKWDDAIRAELTERDREDRSFIGVAWVAIARK
jgi:ubiquinone/menaquinone biosynthesis C-methylase UbiE